MMKLKSYPVLIFCFLLFHGYVMAQHRTNRLQLKGKSFVEMTAKADSFFAHQTIYSTNTPFTEDNDYLRYQRWYWYWKDRVLEDGQFPDPTWVADQRSQARTAQYKNKTRSNSWKNINQRVSESGYNGMGRVDAVAFHPTDSNTFYVGTQAGGIWRTTNNGQSWTALGELLPFCSAGNIVVDHQNPNTLYITIGRNDNWTDFGLGVYKSVNGGQTWQATTQSASFTDEKVYYKMRMHPDNHLVLYSAQSDGLWRTSDSGNTWVQLKTGVITDFEWMPGQPDVMYLVQYDPNGSSEIFKSKDAGLSWVQKSNFNNNNNWIEIAVSPALNTSLAIVTDDGDKKLYRSTDSAATINLVNSSITNNPIFVSPTNANRIYEGFTSIYRSTNAGQGFSQITHWYNDGVHTPVHADQRQIEYNPLTPKYIYFCNDGGLYRYNETNQTWQDLSDGLIITQYYKIAVSLTDSVFMIGGTQDNGGRKRVAYPDIWGATNGGDGMEVAINPTNELTIYTTYWGGTLYRSYDQWDMDQYYEITPDSTKAAWVTPYMLDPNNSNRLIAGYADVWASDNEGDTWVKLSNNLTGSYNNKLEVLDVSLTNSQVIYTGRRNNLYVTQNNGQSWTPRIVPAGSGTFDNMTCVLSHPYRSDIVYITKGGYGSGSKVYRSANSGQSWNNISSNLPNVPVNCILIDQESDSAAVDMYIGTDAGVFYKKDTDTLWQYYGTGMPNTEVTDLEIQYPTRKLRAGTYGRGVWQTDIVRQPFAVGLSPEPIQHKNTVKVLSNPVDRVLKLHFDLQQSQQIQLNIQSLNGNQTWQKKIDLSSGQHIQNFDLPNLQTGIYLLKIKGSGWQENIKISIR